MAKDVLNVTVTYPAAQTPFHDHEASPSETLGSLKARVLTAFGLKEGSDGDVIVTYVFFLKKEKLLDLDVTLGALAGNAKALSLKLSQQIEQG